jgi:hypothetical protein
MPSTLEKEYRPEEHTNTVAIVVGNDEEEYFAPEEEFDFFVYSSGGLARRDDNVYWTLHGRRNCRRADHRRGSSNDHRGSLHFYRRRRCGDRRPSTACAGCTTTGTAAVAPSVPLPVEERAVGECFFIANQSPLPHSSPIHPQNW